MSELSVLEKAIENSQKEVKELIEEQRKSINQTGEINKQLQIDLTKAQEELKAAGTRLFDLEQKLAGDYDDLSAKK
ncbi:phage major capsid protein, partial [Klebsiella pneumoniae]